MKETNPKELKGFLIYFEFVNTADKYGLTNAQIGEIIRAAAAYFQSGEIRDFGEDAAAAFAFGLLIEKAAPAAKKFAISKARSEAGRKGGLQRAENAKQNSSKRQADREAVAPAENADKYGEGEAVEDTENAKQNSSKRRNTNTNTNTNTKAKTKAKTREREREARPQNLESVKAFFAEIGSDAANAERFYYHYEANGWKVGGRAPMENWHAEARKWKSREAEFIARPTGHAPAPAPADGYKQAAAEMQASAKPESEKAASLWVLRNVYQIHKATDPRAADAATLEDARTLLNDFRAVCKGEFALLTSKEINAYFEAARTGKYFTFFTPANLINGLREFANNETRLQYKKACLGFQREEAARKVIEAKRRGEAAPALEAPKMPLSAWEQLKQVATAALEAHQSEEAEFVAIEEATPAARLAMLPAGEDTTAKAMQAAQSEAGREAYFAERMEQARADAEREGGAYD